MLAGTIHLRTLSAGVMLGDLYFHTCHLPVTRWGESERIRKTAKTSLQGLELRNTGSGRKKMLGDESDLGKK